MNARRKLNAAFINGAIIMGVTFGIATQNYIVAICVFALVVGMSLYSGEIRPKPEKRR
jgi:hypothetical protein